MRGPLRAVVLAALVAGLGTGATTAVAQSPAPDPVTATFVATYQRECKALTRVADALPAKGRNIRRTSRSEREAVVRSRRVLTSFIRISVSHLRRLAIATAPPQFATFQATFKADFKHDRPSLRRTVAALARAKTSKALDRALAKSRPADRFAPRPPAALRSAAPACRKAL